MKDKLFRNEIAVFVIVLFIFISIAPNYTGLNIADEPVDTSQVPICNVKWFFFKNVGSSGHANWAEEKSFLNARKISIMYYNEHAPGEWDYGVANVRGIFPRGHFDGVLSISAYGFIGDTSWEGRVEYTDVQMNGFALLVHIGYRN